MTGNLAGTEILLSATDVQIDIGVHPATHLRSTWGTHLRSTWDLFPGRNEAREWPLISI